MKEIQYYVMFEFSLNGNISKLQNIGTGIGVYLDEQALTEIPKDSVYSMTKYLIDCLFTTEELATCSRTGKRSQQGISKPQLNIERQSAIIGML